jgi:hypothetical protein
MEYLLGGAAWVLAGAVSMAAIWDDETDERYGELSPPWKRYVFFAKNVLGWPVCLLLSLAGRKSRSSRSPEEE